MQLLLVFRNSQQFLVLLETREQIFHVIVLQLSNLSLIFYFD